MITDVLKLDRTLVALDTETTGTNPERDRIVQLGVVKILPDGTTDEGAQLINPGVPIPPEATAVHHITDEMVKGAPRFIDLAPKIARGLATADVCGYNIDFDLAILRAEFKRVTAVAFVHGQVIDVFKIFRRYHPQTLVRAMKHYLNEDAADQAHDALFDAHAAVRVLAAQLLQHPELPRTVAGLHELFEATPRDGCLDSRGKLIWKNNEACLNFGKHSGRPLREIPADYLRWMADGEFPSDVKTIVNDALAGKYPTRSR